MIMEKVFGATGRNDQLIVLGTGKAVLIYGYGEEDGMGYDYRQTFNSKPDRMELKEVIDEHINALTDEKILNGYQWTVKHGSDEGKTVNVWLSAENKENYKAKHDAAIVYPDKVKFPVKFKISEDSARQPIYEVFENLEELATFYLGGLAHIEECVNDGWAEKDSVDYDALLGVSNMS